MAVSPLILPPASGDLRSPASKAKLSARSAAPNGTPAGTPPATNATGRDLAEQMNDDEKRKYVKGMPKSAQPLAISER